MADATESYKLMLEGLKRETFTLDLRLGAAQRLAELSKDDANVTVAPALFVVVGPALLDSVLLSLWKLVENKGDRSVPKLLRVARGRRREIVWKAAPAEKQIADQEVELAAHSEVTGRLSTLRDKALAHHDKEFFDSPESFRDGVALATHEIAGLLRTIQGILAAHCLWMGEASAVSFGAFAYAHVDKMVATLRDAAR